VCADENAFAVTLNACKYGSGGVNVPRQQTTILYHATAMNVDAAISVSSQSRRFPIPKGESTQLTIDDWIFAANKTNKQPKIKTKE
jgi:hypothetical protein